MASMASVLARGTAGWDGSWGAHGPQQRRQTHTLSLNLPSPPLLLVEIPPRRNERLSPTSPVRWRCPPVRRAMLREMSSGTQHKEPWCFCLAKPEAAGGRFTSGGRRAKGEVADLDVLGEAGSNLSQQDRQPLAHRDHLFPPGHAIHRENNLGRGRSSHSTRALGGRGSRKVQTRKKGIRAARSS